MYFLILVQICVCWWSEQLNFVMMKLTAAPELPQINICPSDIFVSASSSGVISAAVKPAGGSRDFCIYSCAYRCKCRNEMDSRGGLG